jgi:hypothetical protein
MKTITVLDRDDLQEASKLKEVKDILMNDIRTMSIQKRMTEHVIIFVCKLTNKVKVLKSRYTGDTNKVISMESPEDENRILASLIGI